MNHSNATGARAAVPTETYDFSTRFELGSLQVSPVHVRIEQLRPFIAAHSHSNVSYESTTPIAAGAPSPSKGTPTTCIPARCTSPGLASCTRRFPTPMIP